MKRFLPIFTIATLVALACLTRFPDFPCSGFKDRGEIFSTDRHLAYHLLQIPTESTNRLDRSVKSLEEIFKQRKEKYEKNVSALSTNLLYQAIFGGIVLLVIFNPNDKFPIPLLNIPLQSKAVLAVAPGALVVLWAQFGFLLSETIDLRMGLWKIAEAIEAPVSEFDNRQTVTNKADGLWMGSSNILTMTDWTNAMYVYGYRRVLHDGGFLDGWFESFRPTFTLVGNSKSMVKGHVVLWAVFLGITNACLLMAIWERERRFTSVHLDHWFHYVLFLMALAYLLATHYAFLWRAGHDNWLQSIILMTTVVIFGLFVGGPWILKHMFSTIGKRWS